MDHLLAPATGALDLASPPPTAPALCITENHICDKPLPAEMIKTAIGDLNEPDGSSKLTMSANLRPTHSDKGELVHINHSFELSGSASSAPADVSAAAGGGGSARRKWGRPRKLKPSVEAVNEANGVPVKGDSIPGKRVVRPAKVRLGTEEGGNEVVESVKKNARGRLKKIRKGAFGGPLGYSKRSPGRPPKSRSAADVFSGPVEAGAIEGAKKRKTPNNSFSEGQAAKVLRTISRCRGTVGSRVLGPAEPQWMVDYAQVRAKLEFFQSKMRKAIGVIKPHLMNQMLTNGQHLGWALQELDQISTMDVVTVSLADPDKEP